MYLATNVHITFPEFKGEKRTTPRKALVYKSVNSFRIEKSWQNLTDTCDFIIAKRLFRADALRLFDKIKTGDPFYIDAGYNGQYNREFTGYISQILDDLPVKFKCEDNMYILKRTPVNRSFSKGVTLKALLRAIVPAQFNIDCANVTLGDFLFKNYNVATVLKELKDNYGLYSYFFNNTLVCGKIYQDNPQNQVVKYVFNKNIIGNDLSYRTKDDYQIKVTMTSHLSNGKRIKETVGDPDGVEQKLVCTNVTDRTQLKALAQKELDRLKFDGYRGTLTGFGIPFVEHGYTATIINPNNPDRNGNYYVNSVITTLDDKGAIRRVSKIGPKAAK